MMMPKEFVNIEKITAVAAALDMVMMARHDKMNDAVLGVLVFTTTLIEQTSEAAITDGIPFPNELLLAKAAIDDFLARCGVGIAEVE